MNTTVSEENYLKAIFHLQQLNSKVSTNRLAEQLDTRPASVTDMMKKLQAKKLLHYKPYYGFSLSAEGKKVALMVIRRHRLWEYFLAEKLKFGWDEVHSIAEELEHVRHKKLVDRLDEFLGQPAFDPHGDPIPDAKGRIRPVKQTPLTELPPLQPAEVCRVTNQSSALLELLEHKNIRIGTRVEVKKYFPFDHSFEIKTKTGLVQISEQLAQNIFVRYEQAV